jgi:hypothetical protein
MIIQIIFLSCLIVFSLTCVSLSLALFTMKRDDVTFIDGYRLLPNKYGLLWWINKPEVYFKKKYVKHIFFLYWVLIISFSFVVLIFVIKTMTGLI